LREISLIVTDEQDEGDKASDQDPDLQIDAFAHIGHSRFTRSLPA
jgi:hypothetical protein